MLILLNSEQEFRDNLNDIYKYIYSLFSINLTEKKLL